MPAPSVLILFAVVAGVALWVLNALAGVITPFAAGFLAAVLLTPLHSRLRCVGLSATFSALVCVTLALALAVSVFLLLLPIIFGEAERFTAFAAAGLSEVAEGIDSPLGRELRERLEQFGEQASSALVPALARAGGLVSGFFATLLFIVLAPLTAYFLLHDRGKMQAVAVSWLPAPWHAPVAAYGREVEAILRAWFRGVLIVMTLLSAVYTVVLLLLGIPYAVFIGVFAGVLSAVPFVGSVAGILLAGGLAVAEYGLAWQTFAVAALFLAAQIFESNFLTPRLVGEQLGIHPLVVIFALLVAGTLFGFAGVLLALPIVASLKVALKHLHRAWAASDTYRLGARRR